MPNLITVRNYQPTDAYIAEVDQIPILDLITNDQLINDAVDIHSDILNDAQGLSGSLATRLNVSLNPDGTLITEAIDNSLHSIAEHIDTDDFVRMTMVERDKISTIAASATNINIQVDCISSDVLISSGVVEFAQSDTVEWTVETGNKFKANMIYAPVQHYYNITPYTTDDLNFITSSGNISYISGSLAIFINGFRIPENEPGIYVATNVSSTLEWVLCYYTEDNSSEGTFYLNTTLNDNDIIQIDFDHQLV